MALPDISFQNNVTGAEPITLKRALISVIDRFEWDGRACRRIKEIQVQAYVERGTMVGNVVADSESLDGVLTDPASSVARRGDLGTLVLPWTTLTNVKISAISFPEGIWANLHPVSVSFVDEFPEGHTYTIHLWGIELHNPRIGMPMSARQLTDAYMQLPWKATYDNADVRTAILRSQVGERCMEFRVGGSMRVNDYALPVDLVDRLMHRVGMGTPPLAYPGLPPGWPCPFSLQDAVPELRWDFPLAHCMVVGGRVAWDVERETAFIDLQIIAPPQRLEVIE